MKKVIVGVCLVFVSLSGISQCPDTPITLSSQAEVDAFAINFPNCTEITNGLTISGDDVMDLSGISQINSINGSLVIESNGMLSSLNGLESISFQGPNQNINITNNSTLSSLEGLSGIIADPNSTIPISIDISNNANLINLEGLETVTSVSCLNIANNDNLSDLSGLQGLDTILFACVIEANDVLQNVDPLINVTGNISQIWIGGNDQLLNINGFNNVETVDFDIAIGGNNSLTSLNGLDNINFLGQVFLSINANNSLTDISAIENLVLEPSDILEIIGNSQLSICSFPNICNFIESGEGQIFIENNALGCSSQQEILDTCGAMLNTISGTVFFDQNNNGCDEQDIPVNNIQIDLINENIDITMISNEFGEYTFFVEEGTFTLSIVDESIPDFFEVLLQSQDVVFGMSNGEEETVDFCITATETINDVDVVLLPLQLPRPGFEATYVITYSNIGTTVIDGQLDFSFDNELIEFVEADIDPLNINTDNIIWGYEQLLPFETRTITATFQVFEPPVVIGGEELITSIENSIEGIVDDFSENNTFVLEEIVVNSFDPNDKQVLQGEGILEEEVGDFLDYIVRFQNTGTADAITVEITDELSNNLNTNTLRVLASSHDFTVNITDENQISFLFENINLPPEEVDEEGSNGYIAFQVRTNDDLVLGDTVENTANIFFDFNEPIITNTVVTTVVEPLSVDDQSIENTIRMFPNPTSIMLNIDIRSGVELQKVDIYSLLGEKVKTTVNNQINVSNLSTGIYLAKVFTDKGTLTRKIVKE